MNGPALQNVRMQILEFVGPCPATLKKLERLGWEIKGGRKDLYVFGIVNQDFAKTMREYANQVTLALPEDIDKFLMKMGFTQCALTQANRLEESCIFQFAVSRTRWPRRMGRSHKPNITDTIPCEYCWQMKKCCV